MAKLNKQQLEAMGLSEEQVQKILSEQDKKVTKTFLLGGLSFDTKEDREAYIKALPDRFKCKTDAINQPQTKLIRSAGYSRITIKGEFYYFKTDDFATETFEPVVAVEKEVEPVTDEKENAVAPAPVVEPVPVPKAKGKKGKK